MNKDTVKKMIALVVEDDRGLQMIAKLSLHECRDAMIEVVLASDVKSAWEMYQRHLPHLVLLDITLPDGNGIDLITPMLALYPNSYIVMLTGSGLVNDVQQAKALGAKDYILKPFNIGKFTDMIATCIEYHESHGSIHRLAGISPNVVPLPENIEVVQPLSPASPVDRLIAEMNVLFVDEFYANVDNAQLHLSKCGCALDVAHGADDAWKKMSSKFYDVIFMDTLLSNNQGYLLPQKLRDHEYKYGARERSYVVGLLKNIEERDERKWLTYGMNDYLIKPCRFGDLERRLRKIAEKKLDAEPRDNVANG